MRPARHALPVLAAAAALALSTAPVAHADTTAPVISMDESGAAPGSLRYYIADGSTPIGSITARLYGPGVNTVTGTPDAEVDLRAETTTAGGRTLWTSDHIPGLTPGVYYHVILHMKDPQGADLPSGEQQTVFWYISALRVTDLVVTPAQPDYLHQNVTVSGTLIEDTPDDAGPGQAVGPGREVDIAPGSAHYVHTTTDASGHFSATFVPSAAFVDVWVRAATGSTPAWTPATVAAQQVTVRRSLTRISAPATVTLREGATATVAGTAETQTAEGTWAPLPRTSVSCPESGSVATTDTAGRYACTLSIAANRTTSVATGDRDPGDLWLATSRHSVTVHTVWKTATTLRATLDDRSRLHVTGHLYGSLTRRTWPAGSRVLLEYSADGRTGWKTVRTLTVSPGTTTSPTLGTFATAFAAPNDGYWRARFTGNADNQPSTSPVVRAHRWPTRITGFNASPEPVRKGRALTVTGHLQKKTSSVWTPAGGQTVTVYFTPRGSTRAIRMGTARTDTHGTFTAHYTAKQDGTWTAIWWSTSPYYLTATATPDYVDVR